MLLRRDRPTASYPPVSKRSELAWSGTHNKLVILVIDVLLQRSLGTALDVVQTDAARVRLVVHDVTNIISQACQNLRIFYIVEKTGEFARSANGSRSRRALSSFLEA